MSAFEVCILKEIRTIIRNSRASYDLNGLEPEESKET